MQCEHARRPVAPHRFTNLTATLSIAAALAVTAGCKPKVPEQPQPSQPPPTGETTAPPTASTTSPLRPATGQIEATDEAVEEAIAIEKRAAKALRDQWRDRSFEDFEKSVYKEPFEGGKYIVSGDTPIADRKQLEEFFETRVKQEPPETAPGRLVVHQVGGLDAVWNSTQKKQLTYCVSTAFGTRQQQVIADMQAATQAWETVANIDFTHLPGQDGNCTATNGAVAFDVRPVSVNGQYLARAFFPNESRDARNVLIDDSSFSLDSGGKLTLAGILRHELGHSLGWRHEHTRPDSGTCFEDSNWRPLTSYDRFSVMHYPQCNGGGDWSLTLTNMDKSGAACVYGPAPGFTIDPGVCAAAPPPVTSPCRATLQVFNEQQVARSQEKAYGPFTVSQGTLFEARINGRANPGDPDLYVRFGQAAGRSAGQYACRPYLSGAEETCSLDVPAGQTRAFVMVHGYAAGAYDLNVSYTSGNP